jgi:hypothetical protein
MELEKLIDWSRVRIPDEDYTVSASTTLTSGADRTLDDLIHTNTRVLKTKLEAITLTVQERLKIRRQNVQRIGDDKDKVSEMLQKISVGANYHLREHREKNTFYQKMFDLERERRDQDTDCWKDIVLVMRDFLTFWDEYERAKARGAFLENV